MKIIISSHIHVHASESKGLLCRIDAGTEMLTIPAQPHEGYWCAVETSRDPAADPKGGDNCNENVAGESKFVEREDADVEAQHGDLGKHYEECVEVLLDEEVKEHVRNLDGVEHPYVSTESRVDHQVANDTGGCQGKLCRADVSKSDRHIDQHHRAKGSITRQAIIVQSSQALFDR
jgi:hypothetical protein